MGKLQLERENEVESQRLCAAFGITDQPAFSPGRGGAVAMERQQKERTLYPTSLRDGTVFHCCQRHCQAL